MKSPRVPRSLAFIGLAVFASSAPGGDRKAAPLCAELAGQLVTLRGEVSRAVDNMSPDTDFGDRLVVDPMESVVVVTLRRPICTAGEAASDRPVVQSNVTVVELVLSETQEPEVLRSHVGHVRTIKGQLAENVWWHYKATMQIIVQSIE
jgi:hypothetical protein